MTLRPRAAGRTRLMANHDRVADLYYGRIDSVDTQIACRDRIHWLCKRAVGRRVLDLGCSQGVTSLILAREGRDVLGIDIETEGIEDARAALLLEPEGLREHVRFEQMDAFRADFPPQSFDVVIIGEVLEHLVNPDLLIERIAGWLVEGGRVVLSVPLGYHPFHDHKQTFYLAKLLDLLCPRLSVEEVDVLHDRFLCAVAVRPAAGLPPRVPEVGQVRAWQAKCDEAIEDAQRRALHERNAIQTVRQKLNEKLAMLRNEIAELEAIKLGTRNAQKELAAADVRVRKAERQAAYFKNHFESTRMELDVRMNEVRYRLGDALVRAATPSRDTLLLPWRLVRLLVEGIRKARARRATEKAQAMPTSVKDRKVKAAPSAAVETPQKVRTLPAWMKDLQPVPELAGSFTPARAEWVRRPNLKIAAVVDEFSWRAWQFEADLYTFTPEDWQRTLESRRPDLLLVESTWHGIGDAWHYQLRDLGKFRDKVGHYCMPDVVQWCRKNGIPTVFYNKEDPPNFEFFIDSAKLFDVVFTSDASCIAEYRERLGHRRVQALPFAAQPRIHNPVATGERLGSVCFAGTWYNHRHEARQDAAEAILKPAVDFDLVIFDRMAASDSKNYRWPDEFQKHLYAALPYDKMVAAYKRFKLFLNINSVADSPTMFARRVFELLACGTPVLSSRSRGIERLLGADLVHMSDNEEETRQLLSRLLYDDEYRERLALLGQRRVFAEHTYSHRLDKILAAVKLESAAPTGPQVDVIACIRSETEVEPAIESFLRQEYPRKHLTLCVNDTDQAPFALRRAARHDSIRCISRPDASWSAVLAAALEACEGDMVAVFNPTDYYGPHYLSDYAHATLYVTDLPLGKSRFREVEGDDGPATILGGREYTYVESVAPWTLCLPLARARAMARDITDAASPFNWWERAVTACGRIYSADSFNYVRRNRPSVIVEASDRQAMLDRHENVQLASAIV